jgi:hypothetical protein
VREVRKLALAASVAVACLAWGGATVQAVPVDPGGAVSVTGDTFVAPTGDLVDSGTQTVTLSYILDPTVPDPVATDFNVTFNSQVLRDPATNRLTFVYGMEETPDTLPDLLNEALSLSFSSFTGFATDVTADGAFDVTRGADGSTIQFTNASGTELDLPTIAIATDATDYNSNGAIEGSVGGDLIVGEGGPININTPFSVAGTFQPAQDDVEPPPPGVIPLPAGVWFGLVALAGGGVAKRFRRKLGV